MGELEGQSLQVFKQFIKDRVQWQGIFGERLLKQVENKRLFAEKSRKKHLCVCKTLPTSYKSLPTTPTVKCTSMCNCLG